MAEVRSRVAGDHQENGSLSPLQIARRGAAAAGCIDIHAHVVLAQSMGKAGEHGPEIGYDKPDLPWFRVGGYRLDGVRYEGSPFMDLSLRLARMEQAGIDFQVLSPNPLTYLHFVGSDLAVEFCRAHNDALGDLVAQYPDRVAGFAAVPIQDVGAACEELTRAVADLGLMAPYMGTDLGVPLNDPSLDRFYSLLTDMNIPLFLHPAPAGIDGPPGDANLNQFDLDLLTGFAAQETIAVASLIYGGVTHRHPALDICISHAGGAVASLVGRLNRACTKRSWVPDHLRHEGAFEEALAHLWFDIHVHDDRVLDFFRGLVGDQRLVLGTNFAGWDQHDLSSGFAADLRPKLADNAKRLLRAS